MSEINKAGSEGIINVSINILNSPVKLAIFSLNPKQIATKGFFAFLLRTSIPI